MVSKFRVVFKDEVVRVFRITNRVRFDTKSLEQEEDFESCSKAVRLPLLRSLNEKILTKTSFSSNKEHENSILEFLNAIKQDLVKEDLASLIGKLEKIGDGGPDGEKETLDEVNSLSFVNQLRKMFCVYAENEEFSKVVELKCLGNFKELVNSFLVLKDCVNGTVLMQMNKKIEVFMCDFFEDCGKSIYFSQVKYCKCVESIHIPLKVVMKKNKEKHKFKCPGKYCNQSVNANQVEVFAESILMPSKKVFPKKCKILVGTISDEKFENSDNMQKLNQRLFERTQVCKNCFSIYTEKLSKNQELSKTYIDPRKKEQTLDFKDIFNDTETHINVRKNFSYMGKLGVKMFSFTKMQLMKNLQLPKVQSQKKVLTMFDLKKSSIIEDIKFDEFLSE